MFSALYKKFKGNNKFGNPGSLIFTNFHENQDEKNTLKIENYKDNSITNIENNNYSVKLNKNIELIDYLCLK